MTCSPRTWLVTVQVTDEPRRITRRHRAASEREAVVHALKAETMRPGVARVTLAEVRILEDEG